MVLQGDKDNFCDVHTNKYNDFYLIDQKFQTVKTDFSNLWEKELIIILYCKKIISIDHNNNNDFILFKFKNKKCWFSIIDEKEMMRTALNALKRMTFHCQE